MRVFHAIGFAGFLLMSAAQTSFAGLQAGAVAVDVTPEMFPVLVNGGMLSRSVESVKTRVHARALVLDDGQERLAIVVVDSCMLPRPLLDDVKALAALRTKIRPDHMLISATHTHSAPSSLSCLGTDADPNYVPYLREKLAEAIAAAEANLEPAQVGWGVANAAKYTALRRWIRRPDRVVADPFGNLTVRANMHAGKNWDDVVGESGPEDPDLSLISVQSVEGRPIAVLANFSMHYFSDQALSADYFGLFCEGLKTRLGSNNNDHPPFVGMMSHGCSGDIWRHDYTIAPEEHPKFTIDGYADDLVKIALEAYDNIEYKHDVTLAMAEARLPMNYRVPSQQRLQWAQKIVAEMGDRPPKNTTEVYAREQVILHERQSTEVVAQALRIGDIAIATTPNETYALTGLKIKLQSPLRKTMVIELANGGDGYIPPPEQHLLGGYNTWAARSAGLEVAAEPKIVAADLDLLEQVTGKPRRVYRQPQGSAAKAILAAKPIAYWRMDEFAGPHAPDHSPRHNDAVYESAVAYFLEGPKSTAFGAETDTNRAAHFAGGRLRVRLPEIKDRYTISLWFWNGMPHDGRKIAGWMFSRGPEYGSGPQTEHLGLGGTDAPGRLVYTSRQKTYTGATEVSRWSWNHVVIARDGDRVRIYLNGQKKPELSFSLPAGKSGGGDQFFFGGRCDNVSNWEGRLDEIAVYDCPLSEEEIASLFVQ